MERVVIDTNVYVDWLNDGRHESILFKREAVKISQRGRPHGVVGGAFSLRDRRFLREVTAAFAKTDRILVPTASIYEEAGDVLRRLQSSRGYTLASAYGLANDVLIALSARSVGAAVVTQNERDFVAIQSIRRFKMALVPQAR